MWTVSGTQMGTSRGRVLRRKSKENGSRLVLSKRGEWEGPYVDGKRHGRWSLRSLASGSTVREEFYANGDLVLTLPKKVSSLVIRTQT